MYVDVCVTLFTDVHNVPSVTTALGAEQGRGVFESMHSKEGNVHICFP